MIDKFDNEGARDLILALGVEQAVTTFRPEQMIDESTAALWDAAEESIVRLVAHLEVKNE
jgi:DNA-binding sugar fermentation-stimulating protein